jgi:hypothetical protein
MDPDWRQDGLEMTWDFGLSPSPLRPFAFRGRCPLYGRPGETTMNKNMIGIIVGVLLVVFLVWLIGSKVSCRESFWDKDKQVIEVTS